MKREYLIIVLILVYFLYIKEPEKVYITEECNVNEIFVEVKGEVVNNGVFQVKENTRVITVIELAGGFTENADIMSVNLSAVLHDEDVIIVELIEDKSHNFININTAGLSELMALPKLGESKAQAIIDYREEHGSFKLIEDILNVPGIGESTFESFKELISTR